jgi:hypothetical protein
MTLVEELTNGRGYALLEGIPVDGLDDPALEKVAIEVAGQVGTPVAQDAAGSLTKHVRDVGLDPADVATRSYQHSGELGFHADPNDVVALLCVRPARSGGLSVIVRSAAIHDELRAQRPDLAAVLYEPFWYDRRTGQGPHPVYAQEDGRLRVRYGPDLMEQAGLTAPQHAALAELARLHRDPRFRIEMDLRPGDMQFLNNHVILHSRTAYTDDPAHPRHLIRLWLNLAPAGRAAGSC